MRPSPLRFTSQLVLKIMAPPTFAVGHTRTAKCPELLCLAPALLVPWWRPAPPRRALPLLHRSSKLMRQTSSLLQTSWSTLISRGPCRLLRAPYWEPVLPDVISANLSSDAWPSTPTVPPSGTCLFLPRCHRPSLDPSQVGFPFLPRTRFSTVRFRGCHRTVLSFKPPSLLVSQIAPTAAACTGWPSLLRPGRTCFVASTRTGYAIRPLQAIDGERTFTFPDLRACRPLQGAFLACTFWLADNYVFAGRY